MKEIERKFIVTQVPSLKGCQSSEIEQGYLTVSDEEEVRVRKMKRGYFLTIKRGSGLEREEKEISIPPFLFDQLWPLTEGRRVKKERYYIIGPKMIELDIYEKGLVTAEVEFESIEEAKAFDPPDWFGQEVTNDSSYKNKNIAS